MATLDFVDARHGFSGGWQLPEDLTPPKVYCYVGSTLSGLFDPRPLDAEVTISPNPASDFVNISIVADKADEFALLLNDAQGRLLMNEEIPYSKQWQRKIDINQLSAGTYLLTVSAEQGLYAQQIIKQ